MKNLPNLYPLRFVLSVFVILFHLPLISKTLHVPSFNNLPIFNKGALSVYYFFILSGFLILRLIYFELKTTNKFNFKHFYLRRVQRLYPVYYTVFLVGLTLYHFILPKAGIYYKGNYPIHTLVFDYVFLIPNVFRYYFPKVGSILLIMWSIGIEEQFYLFIPVFMFLLKKQVIAGISILLVILLSILLLHPEFYIYTNLYFYFLGGGILSILSLRKPVNFFNNKFFQISIFTLFILSFVTTLFDFKSDFLYHTFNLFVGSLFISLLSDYPLFVIKNEILNYWGKISYGIYMYHMIVITGLLFLITKFKLYIYLNKNIFIVLLNLMVVLVTLIVAHLSYKYFERKFYRSNQQRS